jgi:hypothetical protein
LGLSPKSALQPARNQSFANGPKIRHLYDTDGFFVSTTFSHLHRNLMKVNGLGAQKVLFESLEIRVKKNTHPSRNPKKTCFLEAPIVGGWGAAIRKTGRRWAHPGFGADGF